MQPRYSRGRARVGRCTASPRARARHPLASTSVDVWVVWSEGVIKDAVAVSPAKYIRSDPALATMLTALKQGGKQAGRAESRRPCTRPAPRATARPATASVLFPSLLLSSLLFASHRVCSLPSRRSSTRVPHGHARQPVGSSSAPVSRSSSSRTPSTTTRTSCSATCSAPLALDCLDLLGAFADQRLWSTRSQLARLLRPRRLRRAQARLPPRPVPAHLPGARQLPPDNSPPTSPERHRDPTELQDLCNSPSPPSPDPAPPPPPPCQVRQDGSLENAEIIGPQDGARLLQRSRVFQGGNWQHLHALLQLASGSGLLYVGAYLPTSPHISPYLGAAVRRRYT